MKCCLENSRGFWSGPPMSSSSTPTHRSRSSSGSFDASSIVFRDLDDGSQSVAGGSDAGESYNLGGSYKANGSNDGSGNGNGGGGGGGRVVRGLLIKAACLIGGAFLLRKLTKRTTRWDHARTVAQSLSGEKVSHVAIAILKFSCRQIVMKSSRDMFVLGLGLVPS